MEIFIDMKARISRCFFTFSLLGLVSSNGNFFHSISYCSIKGHDLEQIEFIVTQALNKEAIITWNSTQGNWIGHTAFGIAYAKRWNTYPHEKLHRKMDEFEICNDNIPAIRKYLGVFTAKPNMTVKSVKPPSGRHPSMLVCSAYNFYPKPILVTWLRDGQEITTDISSSQVLTDGDFYYQFHSFLEYTPTSGETITCMVEHPSLTEPMFQHWDPSLPESDRNQIVVGSTGLLLGLVFVFTGLIYYKKKSAAHITLHQDQVLVPVEELLPPGGMDEASGPVEELLPPGGMEEASEPEL